MTSSKSHQEIELKRRLVGDGADDRLVEALGPVTAQKHQINHVFDTEDGRLRKGRYTVRLRFEDGAPVVTAKGQSRSVGAHTSSRTEAEAWIERPVAEEILAGHQDAVAVLRRQDTDGAYAELWAGIEGARGGLPLREVGQFENERRTIPVVLPDGLALEIEVDRTMFPDGHVDFEVEVEVPNESVVPAVEAWLEERAAKAGVVTGPSTPKIARLYAAISGGSS